MTDTKPASAIIRREDPPIVKLLEQYNTDLAEALPDGLTVGRFKSICINQLRLNPDLMKCDPLSFVGSILLAAQLGLEPGAHLGLSWIIPRRMRFKGADGQWGSRWEATFQIGYQGLRQLAYRSGVVTDIEARIVHQGDTFRYAHGMGGTNWEHIPLGVPGREWTHVYCVARTVMGSERFEVMTAAEILEHRDRYVPEWEKSKAWKENEPEMARKTVTTRAAKQLPMSVEFRTAVAADGIAPRQIAPDLAGLAALEVGNEGDDETAPIEGEDTAEDVADGGGEEE